MITISSELYTELLFIIYYFTVAESEIEASAQVNRKINVNLVHAEMLQVRLSLLGAKTYIIKQHSDVVYFNNVMLFNAVCSFKNTDTMVGWVRVWCFDLKI